MDGLELNYANVDYRVARTGNAYYVRSRPQGAAATAWGKPQEIVLLTGSHTLQVLWLETGEQRTLGQFPFAYIVAEKKWAPMVQTFLVPPNPTQVYSRGDWNTGNTRRLKSSRMSHPSAICWLRATAPAKSGNSLYMSPGLRT